MPSWSNTITSVIKLTSNCSKNSRREYDENLTPKILFSYNYRNKTNLATVTLNHLYFMFYIAGKYLSELFDSMTDMKISSPLSSRNIPEGVPESLRVLNTVTDYLL